MSDTTGRDKVKATSWERRLVAIASAGLAGKAVGGLRELLLAYQYGTGPVVAAYRVAQSATLVPVNFFTTDALNSAFIPLYSKLLVEDPRSARQLQKVVTQSIIFFSIVLAVALYCTKSYWISILAPGFGGQLRSLTIQMTAIAILSVPFYLISAVQSCVELCHGTQRILSVRASAQSIALMLSTLLSVWFHRPQLLAWGFTVAYVALALWGRRYLGRRELLPPTGWVRWADVKSVGPPFLKLLRALLLLPIAIQTTITFERAIASIVGSQTVAGLEYARFVSDSATLLVAVPLGLTALTTYGGRPAQEVLHHVRSVARLLMPVAAGASVYLLAFARPLVELIFQRGEFDNSSADQSSMVLAGLGAGLWAAVCWYFFNRVLSALGRNGVVVYAAIAAAVVNICFDVFLYRLLGASAIGYGSSVGAVAGVYVTASALGLNSYVIKFSARYLCIWGGICILRHFYEPSILAMMVTTAIAVCLGIIILGLARYVGRPRRVVKLVSRIKSH